MVDKAKVVKFAWVLWDPDKNTLNFRRNGSTLDTVVTSPCLAFARISWSFLWQGYEASYRTWPWHFHRCDLQHRCVCVLGEIVLHPEALARSMLLAVVQIFCGKNRTLACVDWWTLDLHHNPLSHFQQSMLGHNLQTHTQLKGISYHMYLSLPACLSHHTKPPHLFLYEILFSSLIKCWNRPWCHKDHFGG